VSVPVDPGLERRLRILKRVLAVAIAVGVIGTIGLGVVIARTLLRDDGPRLDDYGTLPGFAFRDQTGAPVTEGALRGQVTIANFIFTRCDTVCPVFSLKMQRLGERTADWATPPRLVSFSVDPEHDTPEVLGEFAATYKADPARWSFLTGDPAEVKRVVRDGLAIAMEREGTLASGAPNIVHGEHFVLLDQHLTVRGYYHSNDNQRMDELVRAAKWLSEHPPEAPGPARE
jgi:protein SCO1